MPLSGAHRALMARMHWLNAHYGYGPELALGEALGDLATLAEKWQTRRALRERRYANTGS